MCDDNVNGMCMVSVFYIYTTQATICDCVAVFKWHVQYGQTLAYTRIRISTSKQQYDMLSLCVWLFSLYK